MRRENRAPQFNPFYALLLLAGIAFAVTACAYGAMTVRQLHHGASLATAGELGERFLSEGAARESTDRFSEIVDRHGVGLMALELVLLCVGTFGAMAYDQLSSTKTTKDPASDSPKITKKTT